MMNRKISQKPFSYAKFKKIYSAVPRLSVDVIVKSKEGVALTLRSIVPHKNQLHIPGSTVLYRETAAMTAERVARDELGVSISAPKLLGYIEYDEERERGFGRSLSLVFLANLSYRTLSVFFRRPAWTKKLDSIEFFRLD